MPNYITRSNIDVLPFADKYGTIPEGDEHGNKYNSEIRSLANDAFLEGTMQFRTEMMERLMRKKNAEQWQRRLMPLGMTSNCGCPGGMAR